MGEKILHSSYTIYRRSLILPQFTTTGTSYSKYTEINSKTQYCHVLILERRKKASPPCRNTPDHDSSGRRTHLRSHLIDAQKQDGKQPDSSPCKTSSGGLDQIDRF
ncbi:hypothetical protein OIU79_015321 [Salix purpurea]|uniref:Uncharacterized protein n=1 Tax=Salix purpurea TaxID=77065 RepID=A0A9Q0SQ44_SALPP|nr:hypothetical protein OIU79_015321 [Salix purpurea]